MLMADSDKYKIALLNPAEYYLWDHFVSKAPQGSLYFKSSWAQQLKESTSRNFKILAAWKGDQISAGILYWPKMVAGMSVIRHAPVTPYQGILLGKPESDKPSSITASNHEQINTLLAYLQDRFVYIDLLLPPGFVDIRPFQWQGFESEVRYTYQFKIDPKEELYQQFSQSLRRKMKKYDQDDFQLHTSNDSDTLVEMIRNSYKVHQKKPALPAKQLRKLFKSILQNNLGKIFYLVREDEPLAGILVTKDERHLFSYFAGMSDTFRTKYDSEFLYSSTIEQPEFLNKTFDFLGANNVAFEQFKRSFGGQLIPYYRVVYQKNNMVRFLSALRRRQHQQQRKITGDS